MDIMAELDIAEDLIQSPEHMQPQTSSISFDDLLSPPVRLHEDLKTGCGGQLWPAGIVLSKYLLRHPELYSGSQSVIELGSGGGLVGLAIAQKARASRSRPLYVTDQTNLLPLLQQNIELNGLTDLVLARELSWGETISPEVAKSPFNLILAADCVYFEPSFPLLVQTLVELSTPQTLVLFCFKKRRRADLRFMKMVRKSFNVKEVDDDPDRVIYQRESIYLYGMHKKCH